MGQYCSISYPISVILEQPGAKSESRAGYNLRTKKDRIALLGPFGGCKWSRVGRTVINVMGVGAVGPILKYYFTFINVAIKARIKACLITTDTLTLA